MKEELRYATEISGVQCVMIAGVTLMHKLFAGSLDLQQQVIYYCILQCNQMKTHLTIIYRCSSLLLCLLWSRVWWNIPG